jgi:hypothetical protein
MLACGRIWMLSRWRWQRLGTKMPMLPQRVVAAKAETQSSVLLVAGRLEKHLMARQWWLPLDSLGTELMNHVNCVPCGHVANVDKGFPTDNVCAQIGIGCTRPPNKLVGRSKTRPMRKRWGTLGPSWNKSMVERRCRADILMAPSLCCSSDLPPRFFEFVVCCRTFTQLSFIGAAFHRGDSKLELLFKTDSDSSLLRALRIHSKPGGVILQKCKLVANCDAIKSCVMHGRLTGLNVE